MESREVTVKDENLVRVYKYEIIESTFKGVKTYGIFVKRTDFENEIAIKEVKDSVQLITPKLEKVTMLINKLADRVVSPVHLVDVIGEFVDKCVEDFREYETVVEFI